MIQESPLIVGLSCRVPGARGLAAMWDVLSSAHCTIGQVDERLFNPAFYFDAHRPRRGKSYTFAAGQLEDLYKFDANFFGISPRAAAEIEPQQRLMLHSVWEAVEDGGIDIADLQGDRTGVFVGSSLVEMLPKYYLDPARGGSNFVLGNNLSVIANRISSVFNFGGPSYVIDTACSSGLYALHQAHEAINSGAVDTAIVGAVHVVRTQGGFVGFSQAQMLSPTGLCKAFDASADGYVRSEACVTVILMHPDKARALTPRLRGRLLATGINADGAAEQLAVPSASRQEKLLTTVMERSGKDPEDLDFYEAHGTGTQVGDLAEATALGAALGTLRRAPLLIGSAKTNFGHAEPAAGLVGLAKVLLAMEHRNLPASLHCQTPNPVIDFDALNLRVADQAVALACGHTLTVGLSSFGFGGTNVAALVESPEPKPRKVQTSVSMTKHIWLRLSAESERSLERMSMLWAKELEKTARAQWPALAQAAARRASLSYRRAIALKDDAIDHLRNPASDRALSGKVVIKGTRTVFAFAGNGAQHSRMGRAAYCENKVYRAEFDAVAQAFAAVGSADLVTLLNSEKLEQQLKSPLVAQPMVFACQVAQARTLIALGFVPEALIGHSLGEITALFIGGAFNLQDAAKIVMRRSERFESLRGQGGMITIAAPQADVLQILGGFDDRLGIAAINSPNSVTVSGPNLLLERLGKVTLRGKRVAMLRLDLDVAYHSAALDPLEGSFKEDLADIAFKPLKLPVAGATTGRMLRKTEVDAQYLWRNARAPVRFYDAVNALANESPCMFLEIGPKPVMGRNIRDCARLSGLAVDHYAPAEPDANTARLVEALWTNGISNRDAQRRDVLPEPDVPLPAYAWDEQEYFSPISPDGLDAFGELSTAALAGRRTDRDAAIWIADFTPTQPAWLADHMVGGRAILPATALMEIALSVGASLWPDAALELCDFEILQPAELGADGLRIRTMVDATTGSVSLAMRPRLSEGGWSNLAQATFRPATNTVKASWPRNLVWKGSIDGIYDRLSGAGLDYGPRFQRLDAATIRGKDRVFCHLDSSADTHEFCLDPMRVDSVFHALALVDGAHGSSPNEVAETGAVLVPNHVDKLLWNGWRDPIRYARMDITSRRARSLRANVTLFDAAGRGVARLQGIEFVLVPTTKSPALAPGTWRRRHPKWRAPDATVKWPRGWRKPEKVLESMGLTQRPPKAGNQSLLSQFGGDLNGTTAHDGALLDILTKAPNLAHDARDLLARQNGTPDYALTQNTASLRAIWQLAERVVRAISTAWDHQERLNLAVLGLVDPVVVTRWIASPHIDEVILSSEDEGQRDYLGTALWGTLLPRLRSDVGAGQADVILAIGDMADAEQFDRCAAPGAMVLRLDTKVPAHDESKPNAWYALSGEITLRLRLEGAGVASGAPEVALSNFQNGIWPAPDLVPPAQNDGVATLVHVHPENETASATLANLLSRLKMLQSASARPRILLICNGGGAHFDALARAVGSVLRSIRNEVPDWDLSAIVIKTPPPETLWSAILDAAGQEPILHVSGPLVRLERIDVAPNPEIEGKSTELSTPQMPGRCVRWQPASRPVPRAGEVEIEVAATGMNFRDVLWVKGRVPDRLFDIGASPPSMGMECAGLISRMGPGCDIPFGQAVMAFAPQAFRRHVIVQAADVFPVPDGISLAAAAGIPVAFATAWESLCRIARLQAGESILIHSAAGGVGMAAVQIARALGAQIFATASTPEKRKLVQALGAEAVFDSRDLGFEDALMAVSDGRGVDVVLNSLSGKAMERSIACLAPFGRFVELGKHDILASTRLNLRPFLQNLSYHAFDLDQRLTADPQGVRETMTALQKQFVQGRLHPLPVSEFEPDAINDAVGEMQASRHIGKIVVRPPHPKPRSRAQKICGSWVIIGGNGGVGLSLAARLKKAGAATIHLVSRSGSIPPGGPTEARWACEDPCVIFHALDASDPQELRGFFAKVGPVVGIVHAAMTLRDRLLRDLDPVEADMVIRSKLGVAETLDNVLRQENIRPVHLLFLSSVAAFLGNPGQIAYAAANAGLEGIAHQRRKDGLAGTVLALGPIGDRGVLAQDRAKARSVERWEGIDFLPIEKCTAKIIERLRKAHGQDQLFASLDWGALARTLPALSGHGFDRLVTQDARNRKTPRDLLREIKAADWPKALSLVQSGLNTALCTILKIPKEQFDPLRPLGRYGIDSLMAMEIRLEVEQRFGFALPSAAMTQTATVSDMAVTFANEIREAHIEPRPA